jgi:hypothetical protein
MPSSLTLHGRARVTILVMIAALFVVPALVRATFSASQTSLIRLNRGFERPPAKCQIPPPVVIVAALSRSEAEPPKLDLLVPVFEAPAPDAPPEGSPDAYRGPPIPSLA